MGFNQIKDQQKKELQQTGEPTRPLKQYIPAVDIRENDKAVTVVAEMPGVSKETLDIQLKDGVLSIRGEACAVTGEKETMILQEFEPGEYIRRFTLADTIEQEKVEASMVDGILTITLPKIEPAQPRRIKVSAE